MAPLQGVCRRSGTAGLPRRQLLRGWLGRRRGAPCTSSRPLPLHRGETRRQAGGFVDGETAVERDRTGGYQSQMHTHRELNARPALQGCHIASQRC